MRSAAFEQALRTSESSSALERRATRWWIVVVMVAVVSGLAVWVTSPRFELDMPSLVDDWAAVSRSSDQVSELVRLANPEEQRFRPSWILWNYVQWNTFGAPEKLVGPNAWNIARLLIFSAGLCLLTAVALPFPRGPWKTALFTVLVGLPAFLVVAVPKFARDLAWFGTQEPLLIGGMALGGSLLVLAARPLLSEDRALAWPRVATLAVAGSGFWLLGVYQKESSVCALPLIAAGLYSGRARLSAWARLSSERRAALAVLGGVVLLPLLHVAIQIGRIAARGDLVYEAEVDSGRGVVRGVEILYDWAHEVFSPDAHLVIYGAVAFTLLAILIHRRVDWLAVGALASGALTFMFAAQSGVAVSRYYMPLYALFGVALALSLARLPRIVQLSTLVWMVLAFVPPPGVRAEVSGWVVEEQQKEALVRTVAEVRRSGCTVAVGGLDAETSEALPVLVALQDDFGRGNCTGGATYLIVRAYGEGLPLIRTCAAGALEPVLEHVTATVYRCARLRKERVLDPTLGGLVAPEALVELRRLRPPV